MIDRQTLALVTLMAYTSGWLLGFGVASAAQRERRYQRRRAGPGHEPLPPAPMTVKEWARSPKPKYEGGHIWIQAGQPLRTKPLGTPLYDELDDYLFRSQGDITNQPPSAP